ncbi:hypothetical protein LCGC14_1869940 [marine sediment metagenome]|uniref:Uncharacterized protein n=1 Tax=marine sediment metagenome TaxID=412755 RepID=A0A0F9J411_9ZZZZ
MRTRPLAFDPATATHSLWHEDHDGTIVVETEQDVEAVIEDAKIRYNMHDERSPFKGDLHRVASIPMTILMELYKWGIMDESKRFAAWLNERDNRVFRTRPGRV